VAGALWTSCGRPGALWTSCGRPGGRPGAPWTSCGRPGGRLLRLMKNAPENIPFVTLAGFSSLRVSWFSWLRPVATNEIQIEGALDWKTNPDTLPSEVYKMEPRLINTKNRWPLNCVSIRKSIQNQYHQLILCL
jgi:hypothetical protein